MNRLYLVYLERVYPGMLRLRRFACYGQRTAVFCAFENCASIKNSRNREQIVIQRFGKKPYDSWDVRFNYEFVRQLL